MNIVPRTTPKVKTNSTLTIEDLTLADRCLETYNRHWAHFVATGDDDAYRLAMVAREDRAALLEVGRP